MAKDKPFATRRAIYVALENFDFIWAEEDLEYVRGLWESGLHLRDMAKHLKRHPIEVFCILLDQSHTGKIGKRKGDLFGCIAQITQKGV